MREATGAPTRPSIATKALLVLVAVLLLRIAEQTMLRTGLSLDGLEQYAHAQSWAWGYSLKQPPLYTWLYKLTGVVVPNALWAEVMLRQVMVMVTALCIYALARGGGLDRQLSLGAAAGLFLVLDYVYTGQATLTHTHACITALAAALLALQRLVLRRSLASYLLFGALCGAAILSKYLAVVPVLGMVLATAMHRPSRDAVLHPRMLAALAALIVVTAPHAIWWVAQRGDPEIGPRLWIEGFRNGVTARLFGMMGTVLAVVGESALVILATAAAVLKSRREPTTAPLPSPAFPLPLASFLLISVGLTVALVVLSATTNIVMRWMLPIAVFVPLAILIHLRERPVAPTVARNFLYLAGASLAVSLVIGTYDDLTGGNRTTYDYKAFADAVAQTAGPIDALLPLDDSAPINMALYMDPPPTVLAFEQLGLPVSGQVLVTWPEGAEPGEQAGILLSSIRELESAELTCSVTLRLEQRYGLTPPVDFCATVLDTRTGAAAEPKPKAGT